MKKSNMMLKLYLLIYLLIFNLAAYAQNIADTTNPLNVKVQITPNPINAGEIGELLLTLNMPEGYLSYEDKFEVVVLEPDGIKNTQVKISPVMEFLDKFSKKTKRGFKNGAIAKSALAISENLKPGDYNLKLEIKYQACTDSFCLFPKKFDISTPLTIQNTAFNLQASDTITTKNNEPTANANSLFEIKIEDALKKGLLISLIVVFFAGLLTSFTPCIFPMIPITIAILGHHSEERTRLQNFMVSLVYVLGIASTYSMLGLIAASTGTLFGSLLGHPIALGAMACLFLAMSLSMYGYFEIKTPHFIEKLIHKKHQHGHKHDPGFSGAYLSGLVAGIVASPCVGPVLVGILAYVAQTKDLFLGFILLFTYAMGMGQIFILLGLSNQITKLLPKSGNWLNSIKFIFGTLMLIGFYYYTSLLLSERFFDGILGVGLIVLASLSGAFNKSPHSAFKKIQKGIMLAILIIGIGYLNVAAFNLRPFINQYYAKQDSSSPSPHKTQWKTYSDELLLQATQESKPVIIDFYADWCGACVQLDEITFSNPRVQTLTTDFVLLRFDATKESDKLKELKKKYQIMGLPTVVFINKKGEWVKDLTLTAFEEPSEFSQRLMKANSN